MLPVSFVCVFCFEARAACKAEANHTHDTSLPPHPLSLLLLAGPSNHHHHPRPYPTLPCPTHQYFVRALEPGSGASFVCRALLVVDVLLPWLAALVWIAAVPPLFLGRWGGGAAAAGEEEEEARGRGGAGAGLALRVGVTGLAAAARLAVGRCQIQAYLEGAKESALKELRERKVRGFLAFSAAEVHLT